MKKPIINNLVIELHVPDFKPIKEFYGHLGFSILSEDKPCKERTGYLVLKRKDTIGDTILNFYGGDDRVYEQRFFKQFSQDTPRGYAAEVTIPVSNLKEVYATIQSKAPESIVRELDTLVEPDQSWQDFRLKDPFGFYIRITELVDWGQ